MICSGTLNVKQKCLYLEIYNLSYPDTFYESRKVLQCKRSIKREQKEFLDIKLSVTPYHHFISNAFSFIFFSFLAGIIMGKINPAFFIYLFNDFNFFRKSMAGLQMNSLTLPAVGFDMRLC